MSLINKMLQDLDARGGSADGGLRQQQLHAVEVPAAQHGKYKLGALALAMVALAGGSWYGWHYWQGQRATHGPSVTATAAPAAASVRASVGSAAAPVASQDTAAPVAAAAPQEFTPIQTVASASASALAAVAAKADEKAAEAPVRPVAAASVAAVPADKVTAAPKAVAAKSERKLAATARSNDETGEAGTITHNLSPKLMAENTYRRGLVALQEGRINAALTDFERALEIDPRNEAARQTYISLLLENKRNDEAVRQLRLALGIDPRQPGLAMILARLQLEKGGPALQTLLTTLPYAGSNPEYHAFLAGVLQREQRHAEAAQHYRDALQLTPQNGIWWMGLGISLQADNHPAEAREAYRRARAANGLSAELQAFVDRKLDALSR